MLTANWDVLLIALSCLVAFIASFIALDTAGKVLNCRGRAALLWQIAGGISLGIGIWSMHFIGMLAMTMPMPMSYNVWLTLLSLAVAVVASLISLHIAVSADKLSPRALALATLTLSSGVVSMHYIGMWAFMISDGIIWHYWLVAVSIAIAVVASCAALWLAFHLRQGNKHLVLMRILAAAVMGAAIAAMHYTGMAAATFMEMPHYHQEGLNQQGLSVWVSIITLVLLGSMLVASMIETQLRSARLTEGLQQANNQLQQLAHNDPLTGLPNRAFFCHLLETRLAQSHAPFAVMYIDLDNFKQVNDVWGHHVGDNLLLWVTERIRQLLTKEMRLGRLGGDEFVLLLPQASRESAIELAARMVAVIRAPFERDDHSLRVSLSIGIALYPEQGTTAQELMLNADTAMYRTKANGRDGATLWSPEMAASNASSSLLRELARALGRRQFILHYQPQICTRDGTIQGVEALLRWQHPQRGLLLPGEFLPIAEQSGLINDIGDWVLQQACHQLARWHQQGHVHLTMAVNISAVQFSQPGLLTKIQHVLQANHLAPQSLILEITESLAMRNLQQTTQVLEALTRIGVQISIDDFGTGYSSLLYLRQLPARELKIDSAFVNALQSSDKNRRVVSAIIDVARSLNLQVVAEGVETAEQKALLEQLGCTAMQGYYLGYPDCAENTGKLLDAMIPATAVNSC